jgi:hypothetical protein
MLIVLTCFRRNEGIPLLAPAIRKGKHCSAPYTTNKNNHYPVFGGAHTSHRRASVAFPEFLNASWRAGVVRYDVDFGARTCTYYGAGNEEYIASATLSSTCGRFLGEHRSYGLMRGDATDAIRRSLKNERRRPRPSRRIARTL